MITTIILTYNEEIHLERCIQSVVEISDQIIIIDSFSNDNTVNIAAQFNCEVYQNPFINQAIQFQWALDHFEINNDWIIRLDADEYFTKELIGEIKLKIQNIPQSVTGIYFKRRVYFMDKWIKYGGYYPVHLLRMWRKGVGSIEQRWMDEHVTLKEGETLLFESDFVDHNLNNLNWWTQKHNSYSLREAIEYLNKKHVLFNNFDENLDPNSQEGRKRSLKNNYYNRLPLFFRPFIYFNFRYWIKLGFLDGKRGFIWHILQGFWYRFLVDAKIYQIERLAKEKGITVKQVLENDFGIKIIN